MNAWLQQVFEAQIVGKEGIVRRNNRDVHKHASRQELLDIAIKFGFHVIETGSQYIIICNAGALKIWC